MKNKQLDRPTPETDAELNLFLRHGEAHQVSVSWIEFARKLERERDEAREQWGKASMDAGQLLSEKTKVMAERDEAREALEDWENAAAHVEADHPDEVHCGCVPVLRKLLTDARQERDEAREALKYIAHSGLSARFLEDYAREFLKSREGA